MSAPSSCEAAAAAATLEHVPEGQRLLHAVAVLLQGRSFPLAGGALQLELERLLGLELSGRRARRGALRRELLPGAGASGEDGGELPSELLEDEVRELLGRARGYAGGVLEELRGRMEREHGDTHLALKAFGKREGAPGEGSAPLVDLGATPSSSSSSVPVAPWAPAFADLGLPASGAKAALQLLAGALEPRAPVPLAMASLRLHGLATLELRELRQRFARQRSTQRALEAPGTELSLAAFRAETVGMDGREAGGEVTRVLFEACDGNHNQLVDQAELQQAFAAVAPPAPLARLRTGVLLHWGGNWRAALDSLKVGVEEGVTAGALVALAAMLDVSQECAVEAFERLDAAGSGCLSWAELTHRLQGDAEGFTLQELILRAWAACDTGMLPAEHLLLPSSAAEAEAPMAAEDFVAALSIGASAGAVAVAEGGGAAAGARAAWKRKAPAQQQPGSRPATPTPRQRHDPRRCSARLQSSALPASPPLAEGELLAAYRALRARYGSVSLSALHSELSGQRLCSDVLAIDRGVAAPGETVLVRYRVPKDEVQSLGQRPFVAAVPSKMVWMPGGGGCWTINRQAVTSMGAPKAHLRELAAHSKDHHHGVLRVLAPPLRTGHGRGVSGAEPGELQELRIFASPDGVRFGKQVGGGARFELRLPAPERPILASGSLEPTSLQLLWEAPAGAQGANGRGSLEDAYVLRGRPTGLRLEETLPVAGLKSAAVWSHARQDITRFHCHEVQNLVPGLVYQFEVALLRRAVPAEPPPAGGEEGEAAAAEGAHATPRGSPEAPPSTFGGQLSVSPSPRRGSSLSLSPSPRPSPPLRRGSSASLSGASCSPREVPGGRRPGGLESLPSPALEVAMPARRVPPAPGRPELAERRPGGELLLRWVADAQAMRPAIDITSPGKTATRLELPADAGEEVPTRFGALPPPAALVGQTGAVEFELLWDLAPEVAGGTCRAGAGASVDLGGSTFWPCAAPCWHRRLEDDRVECLVQLPAVEAPGGAARFCVRARDILGGEATEVLGDVGQAVALPTEAEVVLRDAGGLRALGRAAAAAGGLHRLLEAMEDAGVSQAGSSVQQRGLLMAKVDEAGGLEAFNGALEGVHMPAFAKSSKAVRRICSAETPEDRSGAWDAVTRLVEDGGGAVAVAHGLDGLDMPELVAVGPGLASLGLLRAKGGERPGLLRDRKQAAAVAALARSLEGEAASPERLRELGGAVVAMARSGSSGESWVGLARAAEHVAGGPSLGAELLSYAGKGARELAKATQAAQTDAKSLSEFLHHARAAEFLGPSADHWARQDFLARVEAAGGAPVLYRALEGMDLKTLRPAMEVVRTAGLHHISCLSHGVGEPSRAELWLQLASAVEHEWGGVAAAIGYKRNEAAKHRAAASTHAETDALLRLAERSGGVAAATRLLDQAAFAGGADRLLEDFGAAADLGRAAAVVARVRRGGGGLEDLERAVDVANDAGGMARFVRALQKTDATRLGELLEHGAALDKTLRGPVPPANRGTAEECTALLGRILADMPPSSFLQAFAAVRLPTLARLAPLLAPAGLLRKRGHPGSEDEIMAAAEAFLRWLALAGGVQRMGLAVGLVEPRAFVHIMDLVRVSGLTALPVGSFRKVASWLANVGGGSRQPSGDLASGLEALVDATQGVDLPRLVSLLWRVGAMAGVDTGHSEVLAAPPQPSTPERAARAQEMLEALAALAAGCGGSARLLQLHGRVDHIRRLEHALELLAEAGLLRASSSSAPSPSPEQLRAAFRPWVTVLQLVRAVGGVEAFHGRAEALRQPYLEELFEVLRAAGLVGPAYAVLGEDRPGGGAELRHDIAEWHRVVSLVADGGGPGLFLRSLEGVDVRDILHTVGHLRRAGLARGARDSPRSREDSFEYADGGEAEGRVRCSLLRCFAEKVVEAGGFHVFWHVLRRVDLARLQADLHCLEVVRRKLCESSQEDLWQLVASPERLEALLGSLDGRGPREDELTPKQRERLTRKLRSAGGVDAFLENFNDVDLACAAPQLRALEENGLSSPQAIAGLARIGKVVHFKDAHLNGLQQVVATLWQWGIAHYGSAEPDALWEGLNQQVAWLLTAMEANTSLVRTSRPASRTKRELELTPARLAQFLQVLRPIGGVQGFLAAFRGLDLANAAAQARILADASVRTVDTARRLAGLYRLLHGDPSHLRGLEQFVRSFCAPVLVDAPGDKLRASERWQRLTESLAAAAGKAPAPALAEEGKGEVLGETLRPEATSAVFSGPDRALDVVALGIRLADAAGIAARPEDWAELCGELRANEGGLAPLLARLRAGSPRSQPMANRTAIRQRSATTRPRNLECRRCGARMDYHVSRSKSSSALFG